jgi:ABC-type multidrug transport system fused ATPase/permease subunit
MPPLVDSMLPMYLQYTLSQTIEALWRLLGVVFNAPIFIVPGSIVAGLGAIFSQLYLKAQLSVKRERSNAKAPILAELNGAFSGLTSIRAFGAQQMFSERTAPKIDKYSHVSVIFYNLNRWISIRIQVGGIGQLQKT